jgi:hypothetical protein
LGNKVIITLIFTLLASLILIGNVYADTNVSGEIGTDTIWNAAGSPYVLTGSVIVKENVNLTIEPGVTVNLGSFSLQVNGTLKAKGNSTNQILFDSSSTSNSSQIVFGAASADWNTTDSTGCIIENATINALISINGSSPKIMGSQIKGGIIIGQASPIILNNRVSGGNSIVAISVEQESSPTITANTITGKTVGISLNLQNNSLTNNYNTQILNNTIINCETGIGIGNANGTIQVNGNLIYGSTSAIKVANTSAAISIQYNLIMNNTQGIYVGSEVIININTVYNNTIGIYYDTPEISTINYNNIMNNTQYNFETTPNGPTALEVTYNYWGTLDIPTINATIYDSNNNSTLGEIIYLPALDSPWTGAPIISGVDMAPTTTPASTVTPYPTSTTTIKPTTKTTATPTQTGEVTQIQFGPLEIAIIITLVIVIAIFLIIVLKKTSKKASAAPENTPIITG